MVNAKLKEEFGEEEKAQLINVTLLDFSNDQVMLTCYAVVG